MITKVYENPEIWSVQIPLPQNPLKYLNCYVLPDKEHPLIIDTGFNRAECWEALRSGLSELEIDLSRASLFLTHLHGDHTGLAHRLSQLGCKVYMSQVDHDYLASVPGDRAWSAQESRFSQEGYPQEELLTQRTANQAHIYASDVLFPFVPVADGEKLFLAGVSLTAIATPGHTKGHLCLYLKEQQILFTGDHVLFDITPNITCWVNMTDALAEYLDSLEKIRRYPVRLALPGHRENNMHMETRVDEIIAHHKVRLEHVVEILRKEPGLSAYGVAQRLPWSMRGKSWADFPLTAKWFAVGETLSHLDYLFLRQKIGRQESDGQRLYYPA